MTDTWQKTGFGSWTFSSQPDPNLGLDRVSIRSLKGKGNMVAACQILQHHGFSLLSVEPVPLFQAPNQTTVSLFDPAPDKKSTPSPGTIYIYFDDIPESEEIRKNWLRFFDKLMDCPPWNFTGFQKREFRGHDLLLLQDTGCGSAKGYDKVLFILYSHGFRPCQSKYPFTPQFRPTREVSLPDGQAIPAQGNANQPERRGSQDAASVEAAGAPPLDAEPSGQEVDARQPDGRLIEGAGPSIYLRRSLPLAAASNQGCRPVPPIVTQFSAEANNEASVRGSRKARDILLSLLN